MGPYSWNKNALKTKSIRENKFIIYNEFKAWNIAKSKCVLVNNEISRESISHEKYFPLRKEFVCKHISIYCSLSSPHHPTADVRQGKLVCQHYVNVVFISGKWGAPLGDLSNQMVSGLNLGPCDAVCGSDPYAMNFPHIYASLPCPN